MSMRRGEGYVKCGTSGAKVPTQNGKLMYILTRSSGAKILSALYSFGIGSNLLLVKYPNNVGVLAGGQMNQIAVAVAFCTHLHSADSPSVYFQNEFINLSLTRARHVISACHE
jgi:hypothetical protein